MITGFQNDLLMVICQDADHATAKGYNYSQPEYKAARIEKVVIVQSGTEMGRSTVDFIFVDETGQKHVVMVTGRLVQMLARAL
jgi:hypothetical protein